MKLTVTSNGVAFGSAIAKVTLESDVGTVAVVMDTELPKALVPTGLIAWDLKYQVPALATVIVWSTVTLVAICV